MRARNLLLSFFVFFAASSLVLVFFSGEVKSFAFKKGIEWKLGAKVTFDEESIHKGSIRYKNIRIQKDQEFNILCSEIRLEAGVPFLRQGSSLAIHLEQPSVEVAESKSPSDFQGFSRLPPLIKWLKPRVSVSRGEIKFPKEGAQGEQLVLDGTLSVFGITDFSLEVKNFPEKNLKVKREGGEEDFLINFNEFPIKALDTFISAGDPELEAVSLSSGEISGELSINRGSGGFEGVLTLEKASMIDFKRKFLLNSKSVSAILSGKDPLNRNFSLAISKGASVQFFNEKPEFPYFQLEEVGGEVEFEEGTFTLSCDGISKLEGNPSVFQLDATGYLFKNRLESFRSRVKLFGATHTEQSDTVLSYQKLGESKGDFSLEVANYSPEEARLLQKIFNMQLAYPEELIFHQGKLFGRIHGTFDHDLFSNLKVDQLAIHDAHVSMPRGGWECRVDHFFGNFELASGAINAFSLEEITGQAMVENGFLTINRTDTGKPLALKDLAAELLLEGGALQKSRVSGKFGGLSFGANFDFKDRVKGGFVEFQSSGEDLAHLMPEPLNYTFKEAYQGDQIVFNSKLTQEGKGYAIDGKLRVLSGGKGYNQEIPFSCKADFAKIGSPDFQDLQEIPQKWIAPFKEEVEKLGFEFSHYRYALKDGEIRGKNLDIEKVLTPFLFNKPVLLGKPQKKLRLYGNLSAVGFFNSHTLSLSYEAEDLLMENDDLLIRLPKIVEGKNEFNFAKVQSKGSFPIKDGSLFFKEEKLLFGSFFGDLVIRGEKVFIQNCKTESEGVQFYGNALIDTEPDDMVQIDVKTDSIAADLNSVKEFCSHFNENPLWKVPMSGEVVSGKSGGFLTFVVKPFKTEVSGEIIGNLRRGKLNIGEGGKEKVTDLASNFQVSITDKRFLFNNLKGLIQTQLGPFQIRSQGDQVYDFDEDFCLFDFDLLKEGRYVGRFGGKALYLDQTEPLFDFEFNDKTLIGSIPANIKDLTLSKGFEIKRFLAEPLIDLRNIKTLLPLVFEEKTLSSIMGEEKVPFSGNLRMIINYDPWDKGYHFTYTGDEIAFYDHRFEAILCRGKFLDKKLTIESFQADSWTAAATVDILTDRLNIGYLGLQKGSDLLLSTEGVFTIGENTYLGNLDLLEIQLAPLNLYGLKGKVKAQGPLKIAFEQEDYLLKEADWKLDTESFSYKGLKMEQRSSFAFVKTKDETSKVKNFHADIVQIDQFDTNIPIEVDEFYLSQEGAWEINRLHFTVPQRDRQLLADWTLTNFPKYESWLKKGVGIKPEGDLGGTLSGKGSALPEYLELSLIEGDYQLGSSKLAISAPMIRVQDETLSFTAFVENETKPFWFKGTTSLTDTTRVNVLVTEKSPSRNKNQEGLTLELEEARSEWLPVKMGGTFCGVTPDLHYQMRLRDGSYRFEGRVDLDFKKAKDLLKSPVKDIVENARAGEGYSLEGGFIFGGGENLKLEFEGKLKGQEFLLYDYRIKEASAYLELNQDEILLTNFEFKDPAALFSADKIQFLKKGDAWAFNLPHLVGTDLQPSLLSTVEISNNFVKTFVIDHLEFYDFQGIFHDRDTWQGRGTFSFLNPSKNNIKNTLWSIPEGVISRIGLNLEIFQPVIGTIDFTVDDGKVNLDSLTDVYSKNKVSRFYLSKRAGRSFIDLHSGVIEAKIRMKQHNILFKLAELFTINIKGHIFSPDYSVDKSKEKDEQNRDAIP